MKNAFTKAMALLVAAMLLCMFFTPPQAIAAGSTITRLTVGYDDAGSGDADGVPPTATASPDVTVSPEATPQATVSPEETAPEATDDVVPGPDDKAKLSATEQKLDTQLLMLARPDLTGNTAATSSLQAGLSPADLNTGSGTVRVYVRVRAGAGFDALRALADVENTDDANNLAVVTVQTDKLEALAALDTVDAVKLVHKPFVNAGSVTSEGDAIINTDKLRSATGLTGADIKIGVISDGVDNYLSAVSTGDLPGKSGPGSVKILRNKVGGDEGTAMMEIVHDVAPGADIVFHDCGDSMLEFNEAIDALADEGCTVICDDISWFEEYFFADGIISTHIADLISKNKIIYVTSAGNDADVHYQGLCKSKIHQASDFRVSTKSTQKDLYIDVPRGTGFYAILQWDDPIGASSNDYDLYAGPANNHNIVDCYEKSTDTQNGTQDPYESLFYENYSADTQHVSLWAYNYNAHSNRTLEIYIFSYGADVKPTNIVAADSIFGHAAVPGVLACAAIDGNPNEYHSGMSTGAIEYYSSRGPVTMVGGGKRAKPDIAGVDGVSVTGAGGFENPFYGTSASAPHVAAVAGLLWSIFPSYSASDIKQLIISTATDMGAAGFDNTYGYGLINAYTAAFRTVSYNCQGGSAVSPTQTLRDTLLTEPAVPVRTGYTFGGWYKEAACTTPWDFAHSTVVASMTLYAKWTINIYAVTFDARGGSDVAAKAAAYNTTIPAPALPTRAGYAFAGWYKDAGYASAWSFTADRVTDNTTLFAKWSTQSYTVSFNTHGGSIVSPVSALYNAKITAPTEPAFTGHTFTGWYKEPECTNAWIFGTDTVAADTTLFAKWTLNTCHVTFDAQGGSDGPSAVLADYGTALAFPAVPTKTGLYLDGWYTGTDFSRQWYFSRDKVAGDMTLYARWVSAPPAPVAWAASASANSIRVSWDPVANATGYTVATALSANGPWSELVTDTAETAYTHSYLPTNVKVYYRVQAKFPGDSSYSNVVVAAAVLDAPVSVSASSASYNSIRVQWSAVAGAYGYEVLRSSSAAGKYKHVAYTSSLNYTNKSLTTGGTYYYVVKAFKTVKGKKIYGAWSAAASAKAVLSVPTAFAARASSTSIRISWGKVSGATKYEIWRASADTGIFTKLTTTTKTYYVNTGLRTGQPYYYIVRAYRSTGKAYSAYSSGVVATP